MLQLCLYAELVACVQGVRPENATWLRRGRISSRRPIEWTTTGRISGASDIA